LDIDEADAKAKETIKKARPEAESIVVSKVVAEMRPLLGTAHPVWVTAGGFKEGEHQHTFEVIFSPDGNRVLSREIH
jgi:hypothetical protein